MVGALFWHFVGALFLCASNHRHIAVTSLGAPFRRCTIFRVSLKWVVKDRDAAITKRVSALFGIISQFAINVVISELFAARRLTLGSSQCNGGDVYVSYRLLCRHYLYERNDQEILHMDIFDKGWKLVSCTTKVSEEPVIEELSTDINSVEVDALELDYQELQD
ncbi:hypothetical protein BDB00DRAFT_876679 [Zychaea mexicana]|uniref:uncharacterized protein n=1 Tax=Zychaea mexicana TaxID=64656 RepID=UPI0022FDF91F|nr:uncharacterized protein BDB00DRAFT_876679 [Zychaea mexicana]KAI9489203.1 hypothetical protein BDB00DRAFT_876679 [Zychaea mexicana]